jgi:hypothetical protein
MTEMQLNLEDAKFQKRLRGLVGGVRSEELEWDEKLKELGEVRGRGHLRSQRSWKLGVRIKREQENQFTNSWKSCQKIPIRKKSFHSR